MSEEFDPQEMIKQQVVLEIPRTDEVVEILNTPYRRDAENSVFFDIYYPPGREAPQDLPLVILVTGYADPGFEAMMGSKLKDMGAYQSWGRLVAVSGMAAVVCDTINPATDILELVEHLRDNAEGLGLNMNAVGIWSCSGNVPNALSLLMKDGPTGIRCAALCYGYMLDLEGNTGVTDMAEVYGFANPCSGKTIADLSSNIPILIVRSGQESNQHLNASIDRFAAAALDENLPVTVINAPALVHAFDISQDTPASRDAIRNVLKFLQSSLVQ